MARVGEPEAARQGWRRSLTMLWLAQCINIMGFSAVLPFLPLYVQELGVAELHEVEFWAGLVGAAASFPMAVLAPLWGALADRYGRKLMVCRAMYGGAITLGAMAFVATPGQLLALRLLQGSLTGTISAAAALVAATVPQHAVGSSLGLLQTAVFLGLSLGPVVGGVVADHLGHRAAFLVTAALLTVAGTLVALLVREPERGVPTAQPDPVRSRVLLSRPLVGLAAIMALIQLANALVLPVLPLFVQHLTHDEQGVASAAGGILAVQALASAAAAVVVGRASDRLGARPVLICCALGAAALAAPQGAATTPQQLLVLRGAMGLFVGGLLPASQALVARLVPEGRHGTAYGFMNTAQSVGNAAGPLLGATVAAHFGLGAPFMAVSVLLLGIVLIAAATTSASAASPSPAPPPRVAVSPTEAASGPRGDPGVPPLRDPREPR